jgi:outer membrane protein assembly factor BamB
VAYVAAGLANFDGTHVYALAAANGQIRWQNNSSGQLDPETRAGVGVQGQMILSGGKLYLAGGNAVSPAIYDVKNGQCLNDPTALRRTTRNNVPGGQSPRGWELFQIGNEVRVSGKPFYADPKYQVYDPTVFNKTLIASTRERDIAWVNNAKVMCFARTAEPHDTQFLRHWGQLAIPELKPAWEYPCKESIALALGQNAVVVARTAEVVALDLRNGKALWTQPLPSPPVPWGLAVNRDGRVILTLEDGQVLCFGPTEMAAR